MRFQHFVILVGGIGALTLPFLPIGPGGKPFLNWKPPPHLAAPPLPDGVTLQGALDKAGEVAGQLGIPGVTYQAPAIAKPGGAAPPTEAGKPANLFEPEGAQYQWRDAKGVMHVTNTPPPPGAQAVKGGLISRDNVGKGGKRYYKWTDQKGAVQITDQAPPEGTAYELVDKPGGPAVTAAKPAAQPANRAPATSAVGTLQQGKTPSIKDVYSPEGIKNAMQQAQDVQKLLNERKAAQDAALNGL